MSKCILIYSYSAIIFANVPPPETRLLNKTIYLKLLPRLDLKIDKKIMKFINFSDFWEIWA